MVLEKKFFKKNCLVDFFENFQNFGTKIFGPLLYSDPKKIFEKKIFCSTQKFFFLESFKNCFKGKRDEKGGKTSSLGPQDTPLSFY